MTQAEPNPKEPAIDFTIGGMDMNREPELPEFWRDLEIVQALNREVQPIVLDEGEMLLTDTTEPKLDAPT